jgi:hypothetical protein
MSMAIKALRSSTCIFGMLLGAASALAAGPSHVDITWMSIANVHYALGDLRILTDGYITRIPEYEFHGGGGGYAYTRTPWKPDRAAVSRVLEALGGPKEVKLLLTGHSHWDHSFDTATWSKLTGAPVIGSITTCYETMAENLPEDRCHPVYGREKFQLAEGVTMRVVRWNHSGDPAKNWEQHDPVELSAIPRTDPATGGLRAGVAEDFPNGGGNRGFLFTIDGPQGRYSWYYHNSASAVDLHAPIVVDGVDYGAPIENLKAAMRDAGIDAVDLWIGTGGLPVAQLVVPVLKPKAHIPIHWDGLWEPFEQGMPWPFSDPADEAYLAKAGVRLLKPGQYMDKWRLDRSGIRPVPNTAIKRALGFSDVQAFR